MADLAGYRRVNYYELCRLCTSSEGTKMHIFREEGRRRSLPSKIQTCLPLSVQDDDSLPKIICSGCVEKLEGYYEFRESCINAEAMLESYFTSLRYSDDLSREGKVSVYVKEESGLMKKKDEAPPPKPKRKPVLEIDPLSIPGSSSVATSTHNSSPLVATAVQHNPQHEGSLHNVPSTIQILSEQDVNRLTQFKVHVQGGVPSLVPAYPSMQLPVPMHHQVKTMHVAHDSTQTSQADHQVQQPLMTSVAISPQTAELFSRFVRPQMQEVKMKNISIIEASGATIEPGMAQIRLDPEQINQLMNGSGLQLSLAQITKVKEDPKEDTLEAEEKELEEQIEPEPEPELELESQMQESTQTETTPAEASFDCDICDKVFRRKEHLLQHKKSHTGQRPFVCAYCTKAFSRKEHLLRHKVSHTGQKMYTCDVCSKDFSRKDNLHKHKKTHGINGPHVCEFCGKSFVVKHYYALHRASHARSNEKEGEAQPASRSQKFHCDYCGKDYASQANLVTHQQKHKTKEKERIKTEQRLQNQQQQQQQIQQQTSQPQPTILTSFPINAGLATINPHALLTPGIVHSTANMVQIGNTSYVCTSDLLDTYRRLHS